MIWGCSHPLCSETSILTNTQKVPATDVRKHVHSKCPIRAVPWHHGYSARFWGWNGHGQILKAKNLHRKQEFFSRKGGGLDGKIQVYKTSTTKKKWILSSNKKCLRFLLVTFRIGGPVTGRGFGGPWVRISTTIPKPNDLTPSPTIPPPRCTCFMRRSKEDTSRSTALKFPGQQAQEGWNCETFNPITFGASKNGQQPSGVKNPFKDFQVFSDTRLFFEQKKGEVGAVFNERTR